MSQQSLENACELFVIDLLKTGTELKSVKVVNQDSDAQAKSQSLIVKATLGTVREDGPGGNNVELSIEYRAGARATSAKNDQVTASVVDKMTEWPKTNREACKAMARRAGLKMLLILPENTSTRDDERDQRHWTREFPLIAMLA